MGGQLCRAAVIASVTSPEAPMMGFGMALFKMLTALVLVCVVSYLVLRLVRRYLTPAGGAASLLRVVDHCPLAHRQGLWIVEVGKRYFLVGSTERAVTRLAELDAAEVRERLQQRGPRARFKDVLSGRPSAGGAP